MTVYKVLWMDGKSCYGGNCKWNLPVQNNDGTWTPGEWMPEIQGDLVACENGYHLCEDEQVMYWLGTAIYEAEYDGECMESCDKIVVRRARLLRRINWDEAIARRFARWCALQVIELWSAPSIVREYLETGDETIRAAARAAASPAAWDAARDAAWDAAWDAARDAASAAAWDAAWDAARAAASAARDAAWDAARAAARDAASAAWDAARVAASAASRGAQYQQFLILIATGEA